VVIKYQEVIMNISSESIQKKEFHVVFKGYKPEEVDKFLDILAVEFDKLQRENREYQKNMERTKYEGDKESAEMKKVIQDALVSAHRIADDIKKKAEEEAGNIIKNKVAEEEKSYKELLRKKMQLEDDIKELSKGYESFKEKITGLVEDFRSAASKLGKDKFADMETIEREDFGAKRYGIEEPEEEEEKVAEKAAEEETVAEEAAEEETVAEEAAEEETGGETEEESGYPGEREDDFEIYRGIGKTYKKEEPEEAPGINRFKREEEEEEKYLKKSRDSVEEEDYPKGFEEEEEKDQKSIDREGAHGSTEKIEESEEDYKPKRMKKKIDIANPDIINDFFKTDED
jgi:cell division initiation protein